MRPYLITAQLRPTMKETRLLDAMLGDGGETRHDVAVLALVGARHVEADVAQPVLVRHELVEVVELFDHLLRQYALVSLALTLLYMHVCTCTGHVCAHVCTAIIM